MKTRFGSPRFRGVTRAAPCAVIGLILLLASLLHAQISEADKKKRDAFLKAREEMRTVASPTPSESPAAKPKPAPKKKGKSARNAEEAARAEPVKSPTPKAKATAAEEDGEESDTPRATKKKGKASPGPSETPKPKKKPAAEEEEEPAPSPSRVPRASATPVYLPPVRAVATPPPAPSVAAPPVVEMPADITIQKSGVEEEQGYEPPPPPPKRGFFARLFGAREPTYRYLSRNVIEAIRRAPVQRSRWKFIIVHNSGTRQGNARAFDYYHRNVRRMQNGMAYHFVIGNGTSSGNGQVEVGDRWRRQINGGHVHSDYLNNISLGICLVGDFNKDKPTRAQLEAAEELVRCLRERCGKADGHAIPVRPHREMNPPRWSTDCPGDAFPYSWFRQF
ncbi:MAG: peptidoglycan recognition protein family protein [Verrucomicrobiota bacterium]|nr:peptidoglycan recognition protein family protein [Verrucomicrobiota bacterium]